MDNDDNPSTVSGCTPFCRDINAEVTGDGSKDRAGVQFSCGLLAADGALPMLCYEERGRKVSHLPTLDPDHSSHSLRSWERRLLTLTSHPRFL